MSFQLELLSLTNCRIELFAKNRLTEKSDSIGIASGFFVRFDGKLYLVSAWHVFSGRHNITDETIDKTNGALPDEMEISYVRFDNTVKIETLEDAIGKKRLFLRSSETVGTWQEHHELGRKYDVAVLQIHDEQIYAHVMSISDVPLNDEIIPRVGSDVFIVGYPKGLTHNEILPIWKRGSIATEPFVPYNQELLFLIDSATRDGLSGAPVYLPSDSTLANDKGVMDLSGKRTFKFMGVYSGRSHVNDEFAAQIGRVFMDFIQEVIVYGVNGQYPD